MYFERLWCIKSRVTLSQYLIFSSPELAQGELLGYCDVRRPSYVWTSGQVRNWVLLGQKLGQILEKPCVHSRRHSFDPLFMKLCQNVNHHNI